MPESLSEPGGRTPTQSHAITASVSPELPSAGSVNVVPQSVIDDQFESKWNEKIVKYGGLLISLVFLVILGWMFQRIWEMNTKIAQLEEQVKQLEGKVSSYGINQTANLNTWTTLLSEKEQFKNMLLEVNKDLNFISLKK